jgi:hypothetical protein
MTRWRSWEFGIAQLRPFNDLKTRRFYSGKFSAGAGIIGEHFVTVAIWIATLVIVRKKIATCR